MNDEGTKHLEMIQAVISRMGQNSFAVKGWSITLVTAILVLAKEVSSWPVFPIALLPCITFWGLDAYYLRQERLFRALYDAVRENRHKSDFPFSMNTSPYAQAVAQWIEVCFSKTIFGLYGPVTLIVAAISYLTWKC